jgi:undecaprenyl-phosphate 4-deoxy-4-formamido-L-arabinose transferase
MNLSIVIPVYNSEETLVPLTERLGKVLPTLAEKYEAILVNDDSGDHSWQVIEELAARFPWVLGIDLTRNFGQHNALLCGIQAAHYEVCITMDDDLQHFPEEIHCLTEKMAEGYDVVYGVPRKHRQSWWRNLGSIMTKQAVSFVVGRKVSRAVRDLGAFRAFRTNLRRAFENYQGHEVILDGLLAWGTTNYASVPVEEAPRAVGKSNYNLAKLASMSLLIITNFSTAPLRLASILGFITMLLGLLGVAYVLVVYFTVGSVAGFPFLASTIFIFGGMQMFALGIIGEYLARMFERSSGRPLYTVARTTAD